MKGYIYSMENLPIIICLIHILFTPHSCSKQRANTLGGFSICQMQNFLLLRTQIANFGPPPFLSETLWNFIATHFSVITHQTLSYSDCFSQSTSECITKYYFWPLLSRINHVDRVPFFNHIKGHLAKNKENTNMYHQQASMYNTTFLRLKFCEANVKPYISTQKHTCATVKGSCYVTVGSVYLCQIPNSPWCLSSTSWDYHQTHTHTPCPQTQLAYDKDSWSSDGETARQKYESGTQSSLCVHVERERGEWVTFLSWDH